jgi:YD repeat-containing protein
MFDPDGRTTTTVAGPGDTRQLAYDRTGRLTTLIQLNSALSPIATVIDTYDPGGRKTASTKNGVPATYTNDAANRLTGQLKAGETATFLYDPAGNILLKWQQGAAPMSFAYDAANRIITMVQGALMSTFTYDNNGSLVVQNAGGSVTTNSYDRENRLSEVAYPAGTISTYSYGGDGLRRTKQDPGSGVITVVWDGTDYLQERD